MHPPSRTLVLRHNLQEVGGCGPQVQEHGQATGGGQGKLRGKPAPLRGGIAKVQPARVGCAEMLCASNQGVAECTRPPAVPKAATPHLS